MSACSGASNSNNNMSITTKPQSHDFLFGRGIEITRYCGNVYIRKLIIPRIMQYETNTRDARKRLAYRILADMNELNPPGRFLTRASSDRNSGWVEVNEERAILKICQILREESTRGVRIKKNKIIPSDSIDDQNVKHHNINSSLSTSDQSHDKSMDSENKPNINLPEKQISKPEMDFKIETKLNAAVGKDTNNSVSSDSSTISSESGSKCSTKIYSKFLEHTSSLRNGANSTPNYLSAALCSYPNAEVKDSKTVDYKQSMLKNKTNSYAVGIRTEKVSNLNINDQPNPSGETLKNTQVPEQKNGLETCIMPISYIGQAFLANDNRYEEESNTIFKELAGLHQYQQYAALYLPSIIGSLCKRINDLENEKK